jgi:hypothetical protein
MTAPSGDTRSQPAVMATKPAKIPLRVSENEGLPYLIQDVNIVAIPPAAAARLVVRNTCDIATLFTSPDAASCEPGLKPNQPNQRMNTPRDAAMRLWPGNTMEKKIVREAFADMLPEEVAWRQKEQFSDGVGYSWIDTLKEITAAAVSDEQMEHAAERFPINPPRNKEEYYYRSIFAEHFPSDSAARSVPSVPSVACSTAEALAWDAAFKNMNDPSGRAVAGVHEQAY